MQSSVRKVGAGPTEATKQNSRELLPSCALGVLGVLGVLGAALRANMNNMNVGRNFLLIHAIKWIK